MCPDWVSRENDTYTYMEMGLDQVSWLGDALNWGVSFSWLLTSSTSNTAGYTLHDCVDLTTLLVTIHGEWLLTQSWPLTSSTSVQLYGPNHIIFMATTNMKLASSTLIPFPLTSSTSIQLHIHCTELTTAVVIVFMPTTNMKLPSDCLAP